MLCLATFSCCIFFEEITGCKITRANYSMCVFIQRMATGGTPHLGVFVTVHVGKQGALGDPVVATLIDTDCIRQVINRHD